MNIVVLSNGPDNYSTKRIVEEAEKHDHKVRIIKYTECYIAIEKSNPVVRYHGEIIKDVDAIIPRIANKYTRYGSAIVRQFEMQGVFTTAKSIAITRSRDKLRSMQLLARQGVGIPKTVFARDTAEFDDLIDAVGGAPLIIKLARSTHGNGVVLAETKKAAKAVSQAFFVEGLNFIVQEYIEESAGTDIRAFVVGNKVVASMQRKSLDDDFRANLHQGGMGEKIALTSDERKMVRRAASSMGLDVCGVDILRSSRGPLILEVNASPGFGIEAVTGKDVAAPIIKFIEDNLPKKRRRDRVGA